MIRGAYPFEDVAAAVATPFYSYDAETSSAHADPLRLAHRPSKPAAVGKDELRLRQPTRQDDDLDTTATK
jgi:hypothetical protein